MSCKKRKQRPSGLNQQKAKGMKTDEETGMFRVQQSMGCVLCCKCGISMAPNGVNMCVKCLCCESGLVEGLQKHVNIIHCPKCDSYLQPPRTWVKAALESKELLTLCVKRLKNLKKVRLINAELVWTEPHSKSIQVKLTLQKQLLDSAVLQKTHTVVYAVQDRMCDSCCRVQASPDQWEAVVQLRQKVAHRRTFLYLEQLILKHEAAVKAIRIKQVYHGLDFYFSKLNHAVKFRDFVKKLVPVKCRDDTKLKSHDTKSNSYRYEHTFSVEICPICREDLVFLPPQLAARLGNLGPLLICTKISNGITLLDPLQDRRCFLPADDYWRTPFTSLVSSKQLVEYVVLDVQPQLNASASKFIRADVQVARVSDFGNNDTLFFATTHLGRLLSPGDYALGYDLHAANTNHLQLDAYNGPPVILVKKSYQQITKQPPSWKLKSLNMEVDAGLDQEKMNSEYEQFCRDLEDNPDLTFNISLYGNQDYHPQLQLLAHLKLHDQD